MSFVATQYPLPSVTGRGGAIIPFSFAPGRCPVDVKRGMRSRGHNVLPGQLRMSSKSIRPITPRTRLTIVPPNAKSMAMAGFWSGTIAALTGAVKGFAAGGPAGAIAGAAGGRIQDAQNDKAKKEAAAAAAQAGPAGSSTGLGPLAGVSTGTIVAVGFGFSALLLVLARTGGR